MTPRAAGYVVDASVGIKLFLAEEFSNEVQALFEKGLAQAVASLFVPDLFFIECANVLWKKVRRGEYPLELARDDLANLKKMALPATPTSELMERALEIACALQISTDDASYVALAEKVGAPLLTADRRLAVALAHSPHLAITLDQLAKPRE